VEASERYADGRATADELRLPPDMEEYAWRESGVFAAFWAADKVMTDVEAYQAAYAAAQAWAMSKYIGPREEDNAVPDQAFGEDEYGWPVLKVGIVERRHQAALLRCIFNPFHASSLDRSLLTPSVVALAQSIYDSRDFSRIGELAALLEEAGCTDADLLTHLRDGGSTGHSLGCWAIDLVLGKS
jgi:hypothetical protein